MLAFLSKVYSLFTLRKPRSSSTISGERGFLRANRLYIISFSTDSRFQNAVSGRTKNSRAKLANLAKATQNMSNAVEHNEQTTVCFVDISYKTGMCCISLPARCHRTKYNDIDMGKIIVCAVRESVLLRLYFITGLSLDSPIWPLYAVNDAVRSRFTHKTSLYVLARNL